MPALPLLATLRVDHDPLQSNGCPEGSWVGNTCPFQPHIKYRGVAFPFLLVQTGSPLFYFIVRWEKPFKTDLEMKQTNMKKLIVSLSWSFETHSFRRSSGAKKRDIFNVSPNQRKL